MNQILVLFGKLFNITGLALIAISGAFLYKLFHGYVTEKENNKVKNIELLINWLNEHGAPKDRFITEQLFQKRFGYVIDFEIIEHLLLKKNPSSNIYHYIYARPYICFDSETNEFKFKDNWNHKKIRRHEKTMITLSFISLTMVMGLLYVLASMHKSNFDLPAIFLTGFGAFASFLYTGIFIDKALGMKGSLELIKS